MKSILKLILSCFFIFFLSCEQEDVLQLEEAKVEEIVEEHEADALLDHVSETSIPDIIDEISTQTTDGEVKKSTGRIRYNKVSIDLTSIMRVRKDGEVNYTFALDVENASEYHIYNLVVGRDANGRKKKPFIIGYEMEPKDMKAFFDSEEDFSKFKTNYRYYTFRSFFADSKSGKVGKNGDCGGGATGGGNNGGSQTQPGSTFTIGRGRQTVSSTFSNTRVSIPYGYSIRITDGTPTQSSTSATSNGISIRTPQVPTAPALSQRVASGTTNVNVTASPTGNGGGGGGLCFKLTGTADGYVYNRTTCAGDKVKKSSSLTGKGDCPDGDGAIGINTAAKSVQKVYYHSGVKATENGLKWFKNNSQVANDLMSFLITAKFSKDAKKLVKEIVELVEEVDIILVPSCKSFEYADGISNGIPVKVAGVSNISNTFGTIIPNSTGSDDLKIVELNIPKAYFTVSRGRTNGTAANQSAIALRAANIKTKTWYLKNYRASTESLIIEWERNIKNTMRIIGGNFTQTPSFSIRSLAPYTEEFFWQSPTDCR